MQVRANRKCRNYLLYEEPPRDPSECALADAPMGRLGPPSRLHHVQCDVGVETAKVAFGHHERAGSMDATQATRSIVVHSPHVLHCTLIP